MKKFAIYARCAVSQETGPNTALAQQVHECKSYALGKGYEPSEPLVYEDVGSGNNPDRPALAVALRAAAENKFNVLIVRDYARLARKQALLYDFLHLFAEYGVEVESASEHDEIMAIAQASRDIVEQIQKQMLVKRMQAGRKREKVSE